MTLHDTKKYVKITLEKIMDCKEITKCTSTIDLSCDNSSQLTKYLKEILFFMLVTMQKTVPPGRKFCGSLLCRTLKHWAEYELHPARSAGKFFQVCMHFM